MLSEFDLDWVNLDILFWLQYRDTSSFKQLPIRESPHFKDFFTSRAQFLNRKYVYPTKILNWKITLLNSFSNVRTFLCWLQLNVFEKKILMGHVKIGISN